MKIDINKFIGQEAIKKQMRVFIIPNLESQGWCDHILFDGPSGVGKTTLSRIISTYSQGDFKIVMSPSLKKVSDLMAVITNIKEGDVILFDEIHALSSEIEEIMYQVMENYRMTILVGKEGDSQYISFEIRIK